MTTNTLTQQITTAANAALKNRDTKKVTALRYVLGEVKRLEKKEKTPQTYGDEKVQQIISTLAKNTKENIETYTKVGDTARQEEAEYELSILSEYLPKQLPETQIETYAQEAITAAGDNPNPGRIIGAVMKQVKGQADGAVVKRIVEKLLA